MALRHMTTAPTADDFTPLQEHQQQTPSTFFGANPVLYAHYTGLTLSAIPAQLQQHAAFSVFSTECDGEDALARDIAIWVSSEYVCMLQAACTRG